MAITETPVYSIEMEEGEEGIPSISMFNDEIQPPTNPSAHELDSYRTRLQIAMSNSLDDGYAFFFLFFLSHFLMDTIEPVTALDKSPIRIFPL